MKHTINLIILILICVHIEARDFYISGNGASAGIYIDINDWKGVARAAEDLCSDIEHVTDIRPTLHRLEKYGKNSIKAQSIIIGTIGKSKLIDGLVKKGEINVESIRGQWESYVIETTADGNLIVAGSDKRGTIYGIYEISEKIGVSPWYWWADTPIAHKEVLYWKEGRTVQPSPKVKYRGIFINDEWPSFGTWATNQFGGVNSKMYSRMFELLLRLKANYLWPAMWDSRFNEDDPLSPQLADEYGIVMGTSHHEPMMRAHKEYTSRRAEIGAWDYSTNKNNLDRFFEDGLRRNKDYDNLITIGMRGDGDVAMGNGDDEENMRILKDVVDGQRQIITRVYGKDASEVPQLWAIFTEVQRYYDAGFTVPDDVTLLFCDNNWGYIRRIGTEKERNRKGGMGMYYHIDMNGGPWNDRWVNTTTVAKMREQLNLAYQTGIDRIWIINVGDLKPKEMPIDFIMRYAWDPDKYPADKVNDYLVDWTGKIFGGEYANEIAYIVNTYSKLNLERKAEVNRMGIYSAETGEAQKMMQKWNELEQRTISLSQKIPTQSRDAFYQLVEYPAVASAGVAKIYLAATLNEAYAKIGSTKANYYADMVQQLYERDKQMEEKYNKEIAGGKWNGMMQDRHIGYRQWSMPDKNTPPILKTVTEGKDIEIETIEPTETAIMAHDYTRRTNTPDATWTFLPELGRGKGNMGIQPVTAQSRPDGDGATLEYDMEFKEGGINKLALGILPTNDVYPARGLRIGIRIDDGPMQTIDARQGYVDTFNEYTHQNLSRSNTLKPLPAPASDIYLSGFRQRMRSEVFDNLRWLSIDINIPTAGTHTLKLVMIDPEIVVEKLVINPDNTHPSYYGKKTKDY